MDVCIVYFVIVHTLDVCIVLGIVHFVIVHTVDVCIVYFFNVHTVDVCILLVIVHFFFVVTLGVCVLPGIVHFFIVHILYVLCILLEFRAFVLSSDLAYGFYNTDVSIIIIITITVTICRSIIRLSPFGGGAAKVGVVAVMENLHVARSGVSLEGAVDVT